MAKAADVRALEDDCPWERADFRADLGVLVGSVQAAARQYAADVRVLARLVAQVPHCLADEVGATPWTSLRREVAVARRCTDRAAAADIRAAVRLTTALPRSLALLEAGTMTASQAKAVVAELDPHDDTTACAVDAELADHLATLPAWRVQQEVRRAVLRLDPDAAGQRAAVKTASRGVAFTPDVDDQASICLFGPAVPLTRWYTTVDTQARGLKQSGDPRTLNALRFDLATSTYPCITHPPADPTQPAGRAANRDGVDGVDGLEASDGLDGGHPARTDDAAAAAHSQDEPGRAGLRPGFVEAASSDCRRGRPVQATIVIPVETALGLSNEPGWLDGYGFFSAQASRLLLVDAELRQACAQSGTGQLITLADRVMRPPPTPAGVRDALTGMVLGPLEVGDVASRVEPQHDPSAALRAFVTLRDRGDDGPTGTRTPAHRSQLDHDQPWPDGPTAAWNLVARATRTHQLKHYGWTPLRHPTGTTWISPAGQTIDVPTFTSPPPGIDHDPSPGDGTGTPSLPDPEELAAVDEQQLTAPTADDLPPWLPTAERLQPTDWTWLDGGAPTAPATPHGS